MIHPIRARRHRDQRRVLTILCLDTDRAWSTPDMAWLLGLSPTRTWMALWRLEGTGAVTSCWEDVDGARPRRRLYRVADGMIAAVESEILRRTESNAGGHGEGARRA